MGVLPINHHMLLRLLPVSTAPADTGTPTVAPSMYNANVPAPLYTTTTWLNVVVGNTACSVHVYPPRAATAVWARTSKRTLRPGCSMSRHAGIVWLPLKLRSSALDST